MKKLISSAAAVSLLLATAVPAEACLAQPLSPSGLIAKADVIVRATAVKYIKTPREEMVELDFSSEGNIQFQVEEVLKGDSVPAALMIEGLLSSVDDFNDRQVPYHFIRSGGRSGRCEVFTYKQGAEFLLFLRRGEGKLTPYWAPLSPTNEQLRLPNDAWLRWVRSQLETVEQKRARSGMPTPLDSIGLSVVALLNNSAGDLMNVVRARRSEATREAIGVPLEGELQAVLPRVAQVGEERSS